VTAFNFSERYRTPVILLLDEVVAHMREKADLPEPDSVERVERVATTVPPEWYKPTATRAATFRRWRTLERVIVTTSPACFTTRRLSHTAAR